MIRNLMIVSLMTVQTVLLVSGYKRYYNTPISLMRLTSIYDNTGLGYTNLIDRHCWIVCHFLLLFAGWPTAYLLNFTQVATTRDIETGLFFPGENLLSFNIFWVAVNCSRYYQTWRSQFRCRRYPLVGTEVHNSSSEARTLKIRFVLSLSKVDNLNIAFVARFIISWDTAHYRSFTLSVVAYQ